VPGRCWFDHRALSELLRETRRWPLRETGGALLGWRDGDETVVARVLGPGPRARHGRRSFEPDAEWQNAQGQRIYAQSGRTIAFLGDWHTHPLGPPRPSRQDERTARTLAEDEDFRTPIPLYAIAGRSLRRLAHGNGWHVAMYEWRGADGLVALTVEPVKLNAPDDQVHPAEA
jgi:integrative and conjugative element protein (TIGR02256 family)